MNDASVFVNVFFLLDVKLFSLFINVTFWVRQVQVLSSTYFTVEVCFGSFSHVHLCPIANHDKISTKY